MDIFSSAPTYLHHVQNVGLLPEYDGYIGISHMLVKTMKVISENLPRMSARRHLEMYMKGIKGIKVMCKIMKYLVQTGVTPQLLTSKLIDAIDVNDDRRTEVRREATDFVRKIIAGTFAVRSYDYLRLFQSGSAEARRSYSSRSCRTSMCSA